MREIWSGKQVERFVLNKFLPVRRRFAGFTACFDFPSDEKGFITLSLIFHLCGNFEEIRLLKEDGLNNLSNCECREYNKISLKFITIRSWFRSANLQDWSRQFPVFLYLIEHLNANSIFLTIRENEKNKISGNKKKILLILNATTGHKFLVLISRSFVTIFARVHRLSTNLFPFISNQNSRDSGTAVARVSLKNQRQNHFFISCRAIKAALIKFQASKSLRKKAFSRTG